MKKSIFMRRMSNLLVSNSPVSGVLGAIGNTPLIFIKSLSKETGCNIYGKAEFMNPGGSIKDRAALYVVQEAERRSEIFSGGTVVEGTAGNTGIGLAHVCKAKGYRLVIFMPNTQSKEKIDTLLSLGAEVHAVPAVAYSNEMNYNHQAKRYAESHQNTIWTNQFDNIDNKLAHIETTGPEIFHQLPQIDAFTCATGTGGTLAGTADPPGSVLFKYVKEGILERTGEGSFTEGIGQGRITKNMEGVIDTLVDDAVHCEDKDSIAMVFRMLDEEGLYLGASSTLNLVAAVKAARILGSGKNIVTMLCDGAGRYSSRLTSKSWLESKGLFKEIPVHLQKYVINP